MRADAMAQWLAQKEGSCLSRESLSCVNSQLGGVLPQWYLTLVATLPIVGVELAWLAYPDEEGEDQLEWFEFADADLLVELNLATYPGELLRQLGYVVFAFGVNNAGNCYAFSITDGDDPAVYEVWHDAAQTIEEMKVALEHQYGVTRLSTRFSSFLQMLKVDV
uniref:hypothetical protein n=1 Tax=Thaumasiovibrio occultus TaxID=1891184 RepID=UPI00131D2734|nr:hypothetical protein [Thaumasiovibrio occultus]